MWQRLRDGGAVALGALAAALADGDLGWDDVGLLACVVAGLLLPGLAWLNRTHADPRS